MSTINTRVRPSYRLLTEEQIQEIHYATLEILETIDIPILHPAAGVHQQLHPLVVEDAHADGLEDFSSRGTCLESIMDVKGDAPVTPHGDADRQRDQLFRLRRECAVLGGGIVKSGKGSKRIWQLSIQLGHPVSDVLVLFGKTVVHRRLLWNRHDLDAR